MRPHPSPLLLSALLLLVPAVTCADPAQRIAAASRRPPASLSGRTGRFLSLSPPPPPPPAAVPVYSAPAFADGASADQLAVYDYSNVRSDLAHYSRTLDTAFGLLVALLGVLLLPLLVPLLVAAVAPWLLDTLTRALAEY
ncbi:uncharacterized protein LOC122370266 [Amphibalanus amphitrite]|uniref:uncharacterized protein LOC122370266 n=1 Tax=Amphibalanus amphitrite TaxID=1232801 RepID=UPI001C925CBE|nr:uncharacterized protein LOC122370266 [Amphibalanus amphitrite]